ncbi:MAG: hypothetical protein AAGE99_01095 [Chlamydiota bacterium]
MNKKNFEDVRHDSNMESFRKGLEGLLNENPNLPEYKITDRIKSKESIDKKLQDPNLDVKHWSKLRDVYGLRIVVRLEQDIDAMRWHLDFCHSNTQGVIRNIKGYSPERRAFFYELKASELRCEVQLITAVYEEALENNHPRHKLGDSQLQELLPYDKKQSAIEEEETCARLKKAMEESVRQELPIKAPSPLDIFKKEILSRLDIRKVSSQQAYVDCAQRMEKADKVNLSTAKDDPTFNVLEFMQYASSRKIHNDENFPILFGIFEQQFPRLTLQEKHRFVSLLMKYGPLAIADARSAYMYELQLRQELKDGAEKYTKDPAVKDFLKKRAKEGLRSAEVFYRMHIRYW